MFLYPNPVSSLYLACIVCYFVESWKLVFFIDCDISYVSFNYFLIFNSKAVRSDIVPFYYTTSVSIAKFSIENTNQITLAINSKPGNLSTTKSEKSISGPESWVVIFCGLSCSTVVMLLSQLIRTIFLITLSPKILAHLDETWRYLATLHNEISRCAPSGFP